MNKEIKTIKISGDSGDGIQVIGNILAEIIAQNGYNISTTPDYPSEIRAPLGTTDGVSSYTISYSESGNIPPIKKVDILIVFNSAALKVNEKTISENTLIILNSSNFKDEDYQIIGNHSKEKIISLDILGEIKTNLENLEASNLDKLKSKNFYVLGFLCQLLGLDSEKIKKELEKKFFKKPLILEINSKSLEFGKTLITRNEAIHNLISVIASNSEAIQENLKHRHSEFISESKIDAEINSAGRSNNEKSRDDEKIELKQNNKKGKYRILNGNEAIAYGLIASAKNNSKKLFYGSYPITPASEILHTLSKYKSPDIQVFQAEDEIAAIGSALGASFGGTIGATGTSGPGLSLKTEILNLAVMTELPLIVIDVQRGGPSTGLPTKTEQSDLFQAIFGRSGDSPLVVMAVSSIEDCFNLTIEATRIAVKYMTPVLILSDSYLANNSALFQIPDIDKIVKFDKKETPELDGFHPYLRESKTLSRPWMKPGTAGFEHRIGGLEKDYNTSKISYNGENHEKMTQTRIAKIVNISSEILPTQINGEKNGELLIIGRGSTYNSIISATDEARKKGQKVSSIHLRFLSPLPPDILEITKGFDKILLPEENSGQLKLILESHLKREIIGLNKIEGQTLYPEDILEKIEEII